MGGETKKFFTLAEAQRLIPRLSAIMGRAMDCHAEAARIRATLAEAQRRIMLAGGVLLDQEFWRSRKARLARLTGELQQGIGEILELGAVPKDLEMGLVDFPAQLDGREVHLCWRFGEQRIRFWHELDEGFAGRKPLPDVEEEDA